MLTNSYCKMKNILLLLLIMILVSCKSEKKNEEVNSENQDITIKKPNKVKYSEIEDLSQDLVSIFDNGFSFTDKVKIEEIGIIYLDDNTYKIVYILDKSSDFSIVEKLNVGFRFYPNDPSLFENEIDKKNKAKTIAVKGSLIKKMGNSLVIVSNDFKIMPNEFKEIKVFFYYPKEGIQGKTLTILNLNI